MRAMPLQPATARTATGRRVPDVAMTSFVLLVVAVGSFGGAAAAEANPCAAERAACDQTDCKALLMCVQGCLDATCIEDCQNSEVTSQARSQLQELQACVSGSVQRAHSAPATAQDRSRAHEQPSMRRRVRPASEAGGAGAWRPRRARPVPSDDGGATRSAVVKLARAMRSTAGQLHQDAALASQEQVPASEVGSAKSIARRRAAAQAQQNRRLRVRHRGHLRSFMRGAAASSWAERQQQQQQEGGEEDEDDSGEDGDDSYDPDLDGPEEGEEDGGQQGGEGGDDEEQGDGDGAGFQGGSGSDYDPDLDDPEEGEEDESDLPPIFSHADGAYAFLRQPRWCQRTDTPSCPLADLRRCTGCQMLWKELHLMLAGREGVRQQRFDLAINSVCTLDIPDAEEVVRRQPHGCVRAPCADPAAPCSATRWCRTRAGPWTCTTAAPP